MLLQNHILGTLIFSWSRSVEDHFASIVACISKMVGHRSMQSNLTVLRNFYLTLKHGLKFVTRGIIIYIEQMLVASDFVFE